MTLSCSNPFSARTYGQGIYINSVTILNAQDISGQQLPYMDQPVDIGIKLTLDIGKDWNPEMVIAGSFKRDWESNEVLGWGTAWPVQEALARLGYDGSLDEGNSIPANVIEDIVGKKFLKLSYVSGIRDGGKPRYSDWHIIGTPEDGADNLAARFRRQVAKGYPKNYRPELLEQREQVTGEANKLTETSYIPIGI